MTTKIEDMENEMESLKEVLDGMKISPEDRSELESYLKDLEEDVSEISNKENSKNG